MDERFLAEFLSPPSPYRGKPFWAWNGKLEESELRRQLRIFKQMGLGGAFMHARVGLDTDYLSKDWFDCVRACIDEVRKLGMEAWMYDEDRWPSGAAGGLVTKNPKYRMRHLMMQKFDDAKSFKWSSGVLGAFTATISGNAASNVQPLRKTVRLKEIPAGQAILAFRVEVAGLSPWYNGQTYLDTMSHEAVQQFIKVTHGAYRKEVGKSFGKLVPGIFTDEPNYGPGGDNPIPWTDSVPEVFQKRYGYDLVPHLVEMFFDVDGQEVSRARYHYYDCITHLFVDAFSRQIGEWCGKNGVQFTGHVLCEDSLSSQTSVVGDAMRFYEHMQAPGIDMLTEHWRIYNTAKQCTSAARQFGRKWRLSETNGCTGWDWPFEAHKAVGDWQAACGINLRCPHLSFYTMLAEAKRDYPASISYQSPWWQLYDTVEGYFARVHVAMMRGAEVRDLLVVHPIESMWLMRRQGWQQDQNVKDYDQMFDDVVMTLLSEHIDFDYGNEELMSRHAKIAETDGKATLKVGKATYKAVLVPPMKTMRATTLDLLKKFAEAGGQVVFAGSVAEHVDADRSPAVAEFAATCAKVSAVGKEMADAVAPACRRISISDAAGNNVAEAIYLLREDADAFYLFVANTSLVPKAWHQDPLARDRKASFPDVRIRGFAGCEGQPIELDPSTGKVFAADAEPVSEGWEIRTSLPRIASRLFVIPKATSEPVPPRPPQLHDVKVDALAPERWGITLSENNNLVLDRPRYQIGDGDWQGPMEILRVDSAVRDALGIPHRGGAMVQPWAREKVKNPKMVPIALAYEFNADALPSGDVFLAVERPETFTVAINGQPVSTEAECGWWVDKSLRRLPIDPSVLRPGKNEIVLTCDFDQTHSGLEIMYLLGNFGTRVNGTDAAITAPPTSLALGDWCEQGLTFYSGSVSYRLRIWPTAHGAGQRQFIRLGEYRGVAVQVLINGRPAGVAAWEPNEIDVTDAIAAAGGGEMELEIELIGHRRNSHGPFHITEKWPTWTGPGEFVDHGSRWFEGYQLVPAGLMTPPQLVAKE